LGVQTAGAGRNDWPAPVQALAMVAAHPPVAAVQQAPTGGCGHGLVGVQVAGAGLNVSFAPVHWKPATERHTPVDESQHAPTGGGGHGLGSHAV
jgi:hypothetical protein